jgi:hypothetical protein
MSELIAPLAVLVFMLGVRAGMAIERRWGALWAEEGEPE